MFAGHTLWENDVLRGDRKGHRFPEGSKGGRDGESPEPDIDLHSMPWVIGASGGLVGYMAGLDFKKRLLDLESGSDVRAVSIGLEKEEREEHATSVQKTRSLC